jgi:hypothetical protein
MIAASRRSTLSPGMLFRPSRRLNTNTKARIRQPVRSLADSEAFGSTRDFSGRLAAWRAGWLRSAARRA